MASLGRLREVLVTKRLCFVRLRPGGTANLVTSAALAMANRLPVLMLCGDNFVTRLPDPVQQVEHFEIQPWRHNSFNRGDIGIGFRIRHKLFNHYRRPFKQC